MTFNNPSSIFKDGKLKPGIYKIQNLFNEGYVDIYEHSREMRWRSAQELEQGKGLWEIKPLGPGYTIQRVEPGKPGHFCAPVAGLGNDTPLSVAPYPVAWRIEVVNDDIHSGFDYVRIYWGATKKVWEIKSGTGAKVQFWTAAAVTEPYAWWIWKLIPVKVEDVFPPSESPSETPGSGPLPSYDGDTAGQSSTQHAESERDDFGTVVTEVTTTVITTRKKYRVEDA